jgi:hypothetical protein
MNVKTKRQRVVLSLLIRPAAAFLLAAFLLCDFPRPTLGVEQPQVTQVTLGSGRLSLVWTGNSAAYEVQGTTNLAAPNWLTVLDTARTNAAVSAVAPTAFFRVVPPDTNFNSVVLNVTNETTGDTVMFTQLPQTNADLVFDGPTNYNGSGFQVQMIFPATELQKFDIAFDNQGDFTLVTNAQSIGWGGFISSVAGPGTNEITYSGYATNYTGVFTFSAVTDPDEGNAFGGFIGAMCWLYCAPGFAAKNLGCASACTLQAITCAFSGFRPSYCNFVTTIDGSGILTNNINCVASCQTGCK